MRIEDFSAGFDNLLNSYATTANFGSTDNPSSIELDEYEKSLFLTRAQEEYILSLYNGKNQYRESFEQTEELRRFLAPLVKEDNLSPITTTDGKPLGMESTSKFFTLPQDLWFITYESVKLSEGKCASHTTQEVYPVRQDEYHKLKKNPFRGANDRRALRLDLSDGVVEIISKYTVAEYYVRYLRKLKPIILVNLGNENSIDGYNTAMNSEVHESLHQRILEIAVQMAIQSRGYTNNRDK
jgi:hypothetical protein